MLERVDVLALVDAVEDVEPAIDSHRHRVEPDAIDVSERSAIDTLGSGVLPHGTKVAVGGVGIAVTVAAGDVGLVQAELSGDQVGPVGLEVTLRRVHHAEDGCLLGEGKVLVFFAQACLSSIAEGHEVWNELVDLVGVNVVRQWERRETDSNLVFDRAAKPLSGEQLLENRVESLAVGAEIVLEQLNLDELLIFALEPSWVRAEDRRGVGRCKGGENGSDCQSFHFVFNYLKLIL